MSKRNIEVKTLQELVDSGVLSLVTEFTSDSHTEGITQIKMYRYEPTNSYFYLESNPPSYLYLKDPPTHYLIRTSNLPPTAEEEQTISTLVTVLSKGNVSAARSYDVRMLKLSSMTQEFATPENTNSTINELNNELKLTSDYQIVLHPFYGIASGNVVGSYNRKFDSLLLCLYQENVCISSILLTPESNSVGIDTYTMPAFQGKKLNVLMTAVSILIANALNPSAQMVTAVTINPAMTYILMRYFQAIPLDNREGILEITGTVAANITPAKIEQAMNKYNYRIELMVPLEEVFVTNAKQVFSDVVSKFTPQQGVLGMDTSAQPSSSSSSVMDTTVKGGHNRRRTKQRSQKRIFRRQTCRRRIRRSRTTRSKHCQKRKTRKSRSPLQ